MQNNQGLNLELFLEALFWGDSGCTADPKIAHERRNFMNSPALLSVLNRWWCPPTGMASGGGDGMRDFVTVRATELLVEELDGAAKTVFRPPPDHLSQEYLTSMNFRKFGTTLQTDLTSRLWFVLQSLAMTQRQLLENKHKDTFHIILAVISMLAYSRSHDSSIITMSWSIYLKACGLSARAFDALHALGLTMSHKWTCEAFKKISEAAKRATQRAIADFPHFGSHDNLNIPMRVFSQRLHNLNHFINATAATIYILPLEALLPPDIGAKVRAQQSEGAKQPFPLKDLYTGSKQEQERRARTDAQARHRILRFLLDSPAFADYPYRDDPLLAPPPPVDLLPCGPDHVTRQHILETFEVDESTYDGTDQLLSKLYPEQMGWGSEAGKEEMGRTGFLAWIGDQLSVERMRGLGRIRHDDINGFLRMDHLEPEFGWFHAEMAYANSLHAQYLGTSVGLGLRKAFELVQRKGLARVETKGVFWHNLDEALSHIGEANFLALWQSIAEVDDLKKLATRSPQELVTLLDCIYTKHVSREAQVKMDRIPAQERDDLKRQMAMFSADILTYFDLREAIRIGDVGRMEDLLPQMLFRFVGGGNPKYASEVLELLQKLRREWPEEVRTYMRRYTWVVNFTGARNGFVAVDMAQEHNIKDIKVTWRSFGPGATFPYIQKISPAIPVLRAVKEAFAAQFPALRGRGKAHGTPAKADDVKKLVDMYLDAGAYRGPRDLLAGANRAEDYVSLGSERLSTEGKFQTWWEDRSFERATTQIYDNDMDID
ncbi:hypothetical protein OH76DRAFT_1457458 [Lentinus brumalis]|uniref:DUF6589 domain-containing protein n=1 Tax=Lentinus brumalis TaxID=2498619 RepID=A0A371CZW6_9APHY|nr:hypothetical protein OH76DRAFT_1457458 [Polyporus brumalis]